MSDRMSPRTVARWEAAGRQFTAEGRALTGQNGKGYATDHAYDIRMTVDGDELTVPFRMHADKDYQLGEKLEDIANRIAREMFNYNPIGTGDIEIRVYPIPDPCCAVGCNDDDDPVELAVGRAYRD